MEIRLATASDLPAVRAVLVETWHATYDSIYGREEVAKITSAWHSISALEEQGRRTDFIRLIAIDGRTVVATSGASLLDGSAAIKLHQLYILPSHQKRGLGLRLIAETAKRFPGATRLECEVEPQNSAAVSFYENAGFVRVGEVPHCGADGSGIRAWLFAKNLACH